MKALFVAAAMLASASVMASPASDLATKSGCLACHDVAAKKGGPAYAEVAKKYAGDKGAEAKLVEKVKKGGSGVWGSMPMPPNAAVKDEDIKTLVKWILAGAK